MRLRDLLSPAVRQRLRRIWNRARRTFPWRPGQRKEVDALYLLLYRLVHDWNQALDLAALQTEDAFAHQWTHLSEGLYLLSDPWFKANVARILFEEELQIRPEWFRGKHVLDAGCGNGRWAFGFAELGAHVTAVDLNAAAVEATRKVLEPFPMEKEFYVAPMEGLSRVLPPRTFDLVFCWGVLHHCRSFTASFKQVTSFVKDGGLLYLYLYGRETRSLPDDMELFKERVRFHLMSGEDKHRFLMKKARGNLQRLHNLHDLYAPLINRRFEFQEVRALLEREGFQDVVRTVRDTELYIRAVKGHPAESTQAWFLPAKHPPYWFHRREKG